MKHHLRWLPAASIALLLTACPAPEVDVPGPPAVPTGLQATPGDEQVTLSWNPNTETDLSHYNIYRGTEPDELSNIATVPAGTETFLDQDVENDVTFHYAIDAENDAGDRSDRTDTVPATPREADPDAPVVTDTQPADGDIDVARNTVIRVTFSKAMGQSATQAAFTIDPTVDCDFSFDQDDTRLSCTPDEHLQTNTDYTVTIGTDAEDTDGNNLENAHTFNFTTGEDVLQQCVFDQSQFDNCVFAE